VCEDRGHRPSGLVSSGTDANLTDPGPPPAVDPPGRRSDPTGHRREPPRCVSARGALFFPGVG